MSKATEMIIEKNAEPTWKVTCTAPSPGLREALVDILAHCDEANVVYAHQPNCTCDRCIIGRIARKALEEGAMAKRYDPEGDDAWMSSRQDGDYVLYSDYAALSEENRRLREALGLLINFIPEGWPMPFGWNQVVAQARKAMEG